MGERSKVLEQAERAAKRSNLIDWICVSEQIKTNNNTIRNLTGEYKKIEKALER